MGEKQTRMMLEQEKGMSALCQPTEHWEKGNNSQDLVFSENL